MDCIVFLLSLKGWNEPMKPNTTTMQILLDTKTTKRQDGTFNYEPVIYTFYQAGKYKQWSCMYRSPFTLDTQVRFYKSEEGAKKAQQRMINQGGTTCLDAIRKVYINEY